MKTTLLLFSSVFLLEGKAGSF